MTRTENKSLSLVRIVDDDDAVRDAISFMLRCKGWRTIEYASATEFLQKDDIARPGCLVLDIRMPGLSGLELQRTLKGRAGNLPIIFLTGHGTVSTAVQVLKRGAFDFLQKPVDNAVLVETISAASELSLVRARGELTGEEALEALSAMSDREKEILGLVSQGIPNASIAERLNISIRTVQGHRNNVYRKLRAHNEESLAACLERAKRASKD